MASSSKEQELAIKIAGKVENSFKQSLGVTEDGLNKIASVAKKAAAVAAAAFAAVKVGDFISGAVDEYAEFEQAMANTSAIAGASADDYAKLSAAARDLHGFGGGRCLGIYGTGGMECGRKYRSLNTSA